MLERTGAMTRNGKKVEKKKKNTSDTERNLKKKAKKRRNYRLGTITV